MGLRLALCSDRRRANGSGCALLASDRWRAGVLLCSHLVHTEYLVSGVFYLAGSCNLSHSAQLVTWRRAHHGKFFRIDFLEVIYTTFRSDLRKCLAGGGESDLRKCLAGGGGSALQAAAEALSALGARGPLPELLQLVACPSCCRCC